MSLVPGLNLPYGIQPLNDILIDSWAGPYSSIQEANETIPSSVRIQTRFVNIIDVNDSNKGKLYWYKDGILDSDLVAFGTDTDFGNYPKRYFIASRILTEDTLQYSGTLFFSIEDWLITTQENPDTNNLFPGLYYVPLKYQSNNQVFNIPANYGFSYNLEGQAGIILESQVYTADNSIMELLTNIAYVPGYGTFNINLGINGYVSRIALQSDGKIIVVGSFNYYQQVPVKNIVRLNPNGSIDLTFVSDAGFDKEVLDIKILPDDSIIAVGYFQNYNNIQSPNIVKLLSNGLKDISFTSPFPYSANIYQIFSLGIQSDGSIIIGQINYGAVKLNALGNILGMINSNAKVTAICVNSDDTIYVGGEFTILGTTRKYLAKINADFTLDLDFVFDPTWTMSYGNSAFPIISKILTQSDGKIIIAGTFTLSKSTYLGRANLCRLNTDGTLDTTFSFLLSTGNITDFCIDENDKITIIGNHDSISYEILNNPMPFTVLKQGGISKLLANGLPDDSFNEVLRFPIITTNEIPKCIILDSLNKYLIGGNFIMYNNKNATKIIRLFSDGESDTNSDLKWLTKGFKRNSPIPGAISYLWLASIDNKLCLVTNLQIDSLTFKFNLLTNYGSGSISISS